MNKKKYITMTKQEKINFEKELIELSEKSEYTKFTNELNEINNINLSVSEKLKVKNLVNITFDSFKENNSNLITLTEMFELYDIRVHIRIFAKYVKSAIAPYLYNSHKGNRLYLKNKVEYIIDNVFSKYGIAYLKN